MRIQIERGAIAHLGCRDAKVAVKALNTDSRRQECSDSDLEFTNEKGIALKL
jgi:hypothetical protein